MDPTFVGSVDYWPINIGSGPEFLLVYVVMSVLVFGVARVVQLIVTSSLDRLLAAPPSFQGDYRRAPREASTIEIGKLPAGSDIYRVAWLRRGKEGVASTLVAQACAQGWLDDVRVVGPVASDAPPELQRFHRALAGVPALSVSDVRRAATDLDPRWIEATEAHLTSLGLLRPPGRRFLGALVILAGGAFLLWIGVTRLLRGIALDHPVGFLAVLLVAVVGATVFLLVPARRSSDAERYLAWLDGVTYGFRNDAAQGVARHEHDWMIAAAMGGATALPFLAFYGVEKPPFIQAGSWTSGSSGSSCGSSCGGSSCGGGGCGGGGCGG